MINQNKKSYVKFPEGKQSEFLRKVKSRVPLTWIRLAKILNVCRSMIYFYLNEDSKMPYPSFIKLCQMAGLDSHKFEYEIINLTFKGVAKIPDKITPKLAEFVGVILEDGHISALNNQICISMDGVLDKKYVNKIIKNQFVSLFGKQPLICYSKISRNIRCAIYSKEACDFLTKYLGLPNGKKKYNSKNKIPLKFFNDEELLRSVIRGLFDTEGGLYQHNKTSPRLYIYNTSEPLLNSIHLALTKLGYKSIKKKRWIKICRKHEIKRFFNEIGTNNLQKQLKYQIWLEEGKVPKNTRILEYITRL
jgi:hypothetical protein